MKIINIFLCIIFLIFAGLQINDPDPWVWVAIYKVVAVFCGLAATGRFYPKIILASLAICAGGLVWYLPDFFHWLTTGMASITGSMKASSPYIELVREFLGLVIIFFTLLWLYRSAGRDAQ